MIHTLILILFILLVLRVLGIRGCLDGCGCLLLVLLAVIIFLAFAGHYSYTTYQ